MQSEAVVTTDRRTDAVRAELAALSFTIGKNFGRFQLMIDSQPKLFGALNKILNCTISFDVKNCMLDLTLTGTPQVLAEAWRAVRAAGYRPVERPAPGKTSFTVLFTCLGQPSIWFSYSSTVCQRVQVGTELKEVPVYEVQCGEGWQAAITHATDV